MKTQVQPQMKIRILQQEHRQTETLEISYTLYRVPSSLASYYAIEISAGEEHDMCMVGEDPRRAEKLLEILVNETVTPCTLREILHDTEREEEEGRYRENPYKKSSGKSLQMPKNVVI